MTRRRFAMLGVLVLGFGGALMTGACVTGDLGGPSESGPGPAGSCVAPPDPPEDTPTECPAPMVKPCMLYHIPLNGNPSSDVALRNKYIAAFGSNCYMSVVNTFDCFYKKEQMTAKGKACTDAKMIAELAGAAPFLKNYDCEEVKGTENWSLQVGSDPANKLYINYQAAPLETSFIDVDGTPTEINGPYRNLPQLTTVRPGGHFYCKTGIVGPDGGPLSQRGWILQVNRNANGGKIRSDLAGFTYPCEDENCKPTICTEPEFLKDPNDKKVPRYDLDRAEVNHVVRKTDLRGCDWGTNANSNAAVISARLNQHFYNNYPLKNEVEQINKVPPYAP